MGTRFLCLLFIFSLSSTIKTGFCQRHPQEKKNAIETQRFHSVLSAYSVLVIVFFDFRYFLCRSRNDTQTVIAHAVKQSIKLPPLRGLLGVIIRKEKLVYRRRCLDFTAKLECGSMIVTANGYLLDRTEEERDRRLKEALRRLGEMAGSYDIRLILLNQHEDATNRIRTIEDMKRAMEWADGVNVEVGVDTASVYEAGETLKEWLEAFGTRLTYVNLSNSKFDGGRYYWGDGYLNLRDILEALEEGAYAGAISCHYMIRDYLSKPWAADESSARMISWILEEGGGEHGE